MIHKIFAVRDQKAAAFLPPFVLPTEGMAIRTFNDLCVAEDHSFSKHPEDYALVTFGTWDDDTGEHILLSIPKTVITGLQATAAAPPNTD